jgi:hypothetical protein
MPRPFKPKPYGLGAAVSWHQGETVRTGVIFSLSSRGGNAMVFAAPDDPTNPPTSLEYAVMLGVGKRHRDAAGHCQHFETFWRAKAAIESVEVAA